MCIVGLSFGVARGLVQLVHRSVIATDRTSVVHSWVVTSIGAAATNPPGKAIIAEVREEERTIISRKYRIRRIRRIRGPT
jgi:hypothetical protein